MAAEVTHGQAVIDATVNTVVPTTVGTIELPTRGQPWKLDQVTAQVVNQTNTAAEACSGIISLDAISGDVEPDARPSNFPVVNTGSALGATLASPGCPIHAYDLNFDAAGKANINFDFTLDLAATAAPIVAAGIKYGPNLVTPSRFKFADRVRADVTTNVNQQVGTIQLSEKAKRIVGIMGTVIQDGVITAGEELAGLFSLRSDDVDLVPSTWLFNDIYGAGLGALILSGIASAPKPHFVDIPVPGGARIDCFVDLITAVTNACNVSITIFYE